jgi:hypothetical protein
MRTGAVASLAVCVLVAGQTTPTRPPLLPYPGAKEFCSQHVTGAPGPDGPGPHITLSVYATADPLATVVAHYQRTIGQRNHRHEGNEDVWRFPLERPDAVLTVTSAGKADLHPQCAKPPAAAATVIVISSMARPR